MHVMGSVFGKLQFKIHFRNDFDKFSIRKSKPQLTEIFWLFHIRVSRYFHACQNMSKGIFLVNNTFKLA